MIFCSSNDVWCFDLESHCWSKPETTDPKPSPRYGHSQIFLDNETLLIIGKEKHEWAIYCQGTFFVLIMFLQGDVENLTQS